MLSKMSGNQIVKKHTFPKKLTIISLTISFNYYFCDKIFPTYEENNDYVDTVDNFLCSAWQYQCDFKYGAIQHDLQNRD